MYTTISTTLDIEDSVQHRLLYLKWNEYNCLEINIELMTLHCGPFWWCTFVNDGPGAGGASSHTHTDDHSQLYQSHIATPIARFIKKCIHFRAPTTRACTCLYSDSVMMTQILGAGITPSETHEQWKWINLVQTSYFVQIWWLEYRVVPINIVFDSFSSHHQQNMHKQRMWAINPTCP